MSTSSFLLLLGAIAAEVTATSSLKASAGFTRPAPTAVVIVGYLTAFWLLGQSLKTIPIGAAYAIWSGVGTAAIAAIGAIFFREKLSAVQLAAIALIVVGVVLLQLFTPRTSAP